MFHILLFLYAFTLWTLRSSHTAVKCVHFISVTAILDLWRMSTSHDLEVAPIKVWPKKHEDSSWNFCCYVALELEIHLRAKIPSKRHQKLLLGQGLKVKFLWHFELFLWASTVLAMKPFCHHCNIVNRSFIIVSVAVTILCCVCWLFGRYTARGIHCKRWKNQSFFVLRGNM